ncbi:MAG: protein kinase [Planctomycetes bacterium]|nr:protein kinase [Planctomycetota bacterium]
MPSPDPFGPLQDPLLEKVPVVCGHKVLDRVVLLERQGVGGMGIVYLGFDLELNDAVAVKFLRPSLALEVDTIERFQREARIAQRITHQNVVRVHGVDQRHGLHYLVMEYVDGETAPQRISRLGPMNEAEAIAVMHGAASGLAEAHRLGLVHRDVKPDNVLICRSGRVKVADLGLVRMARDAQGRSLIGNTSMIMGTPEFMPPEQWHTPNVRPSADVWALGATLQFLVTGAMPSSAFPGLELLGWSQHVDCLSLRRRRRDLSPRLHAVLERSTQRDPAARFADAGALQRALAEFEPVDETLLRDAGQRSTTTARLPTEEMLSRIKTRLGQPVAIVRKAPRARSQGRRRRTEAPVLPVLLGAIFLVSLVLVWSGVGQSASESAAESASAATTANDRARDGNVDPGKGKPPERPEVTPAAAERPAPKLQIELQDGERLTAGTVVEIVAETASNVLVTANGVAAVEAARNGSKWLWTAPSKPGSVNLRFDAVDAVGKKAQPVFRSVEVVAPQPGAVATRRWKQVAGRWYMACSAQGAARLEVRCGGAAPLDVLPSEAGDFEVPLPEALSPDLVIELVAIAADDTRSSTTLVTLGEVRPDPRLELLEPRVGVPLSGSHRVRIGVSYPFADLQLSVQDQPAQPVAGEAGVYETSIGFPAQGGLELTLAAACPGGAPVRKQMRVGADLHECSITTGIGLVVQPIPAGLVWLGPDELHTVREFLIKEPYWIGEDEVSRAQWAAAGQRLPEGQTADDLPVTGVTYAEAMAFCEWLTASERKAGRLPTGCIYSLPPEVWWEGACRGGNGAGQVLLGCEIPPHPRPTLERVGEGESNAYKLRHMHGNAAEWTLDYLQAPYDMHKNGSPPPVNPSGSLATVRGGAWTDFPDRLTANVRRVLLKKSTNSRIGLRVALLPERL